MCEILYHLTVAWPCSENIKNYRCRSTTETSTALQRTLLSTTFLFMQNTLTARAENRKATQIGQEMWGDRPIWGRKRHQSRISLYSGVWMESESHLLFSLYHFWYGQCFLRQKAHHEWTSILKSTEIWMPDRIPVRLGKASDAETLTVPSSITEHRNRTPPHRGKNLSNL